MDISRIDKQKAKAAVIFIVIGALILALAAWLTSKSSSFELIDNSSGKMRYKGVLTGTSWVDTKIKVSPGTEVYIKSKNHCECQISAKLGPEVRSTSDEYYATSLTIKSSEGGNLMLKKTDSKGMFSRDELDMEISFDQ